MKATLEFNLPEEQTEYELTNMAMAYYCMLSDIEECIYKYHKYQNPKDPETLIQRIQQAMGDFKIKA